MGELRDLLREGVEERREEILEAAGYVPGVSTKIPPHERDRLIAERRRGVKLKTLAAEYGVNKATVSRAIRSRLIELDEYRPDEFLEFQRRRRREGWQHIRAIFDERDEEFRAIRDATRACARRADLQQQALEDAEREQRRLKMRVFRERQMARALAKQGL